MEDIFAYAAKCVDNKSVLARLGHSAKLHGVRSALSSKGSAASKFGSLVGAGVRATLNAIPIPVVGSLIGSLEQKVEKVIKGQLHSRNLGKSTTTTEKVKFTLKELSVEELDRFRWKVSEAITEFNKLVPGHAASLAKKRADHATCDAFLDLALAAEQVNRRIRKLKEACLGILGAIKITSEWIEECENGPGAGPVTMSGGTRSGPPTTGVNKAIADLKTLLAANINAELDAANRLTTDALKEEYVANSHGKCDRWCCFRTAGATDNWANFKKNSAFVLRHLTETIVPDSFNNNLGTLWKTE